MCDIRSVSFKGRQIIERCRPVKNPSALVRGCVVTRKVLPLDETGPAIGSAQPIAAHHRLCYTTRTFSQDHCGFMPTYEYQFEKCKKTFDVFQSMNDPVLTTCPKELCRLKKWGRGKVKRQLGTGAGLIFKGSGFYI